MKRITPREKPWLIPSNHGTMVFGDEFAGIEDLILVTRGGTPVAVPFDVSRTELTDVLTAAAANQLGLRSLDHVRRTYIESHELGALQCPDSYRHMLEATAELKELARGAARGYYAIRDKPDRPGLFGAGAALVRLYMSFRAATFMLRNGMHFEFGLVGRLILEQIAWAYAVHRLMTDEMFSVNPQSQMSKLKEIVPDAGRLYGKLSDQAHIPPQVSLRYLDFTNTADPGIHLTMYQFGGIDLTTLAKLTDAYVVCVDVVAASTKGSWGCARLRPDGTPVISKRRESLRMIRRVEKTVRRYTTHSGAA